MKVVLSVKASQQLINIFDYLEQTFSPATRKKFQTRIDRYIAAIKLLPLGFPESTIFPGCRKCVATRQTSIIYKVHDNVIEIVAILDNRRQP